MWDYIFPFFCLGCNQEGKILCHKCQEALHALGVFVPLEDKIYLSDHIALGVFDEENLLGKLIYAYKYNFAKSVLDIFELLIKDFLKNNAQYFEGADCIVPVPLHKRRFAERGFNQSKEIGDILSRLLGLELCDVLVREKSTKQQAKLGKYERSENVSGAFALKSGSFVQNKNIIVVDDVFTTGSTLEECARVLKASGAEKVRAWTLARG